MRSRLMPVLVLALVAVALLGGAAYGAVVPVPPYETSTECLECHGVALSGAALSKVDFGDTVDYSACMKCHWVRPGTPYILDHAKALYLPDCTSCHLYMPTARPWAGQVSTLYGFFASATSLDSPAAAVHAAHVNGSWPQGGSAVDCDEYCKSCHGPTGCSMCHTVSLTQDGHGVHVASADPLLAEYAPTVYPTAAGVPPTSAAVSTVNYASTSVSCAASGCHPRSTLSATPTPACSSCHALKATEHGYGTFDHIAADSVLDGTACSACHSLDLATVHGDAAAIGTSCATCHPTPRNSLAAWDQSCATGGCHTAESTAPMHAGTVAAHAVASTNTLCLDCHAGIDLGSIHTAAVDDSGKTSCFVCHTGATGQPATSDCTVCHFTFEAHYGAERHTSSWAPLLSCGGSGCHDISGDLMTVHQEKDATFTCAGCHNNWLYADEIAAGLTGCGDCHTNIYETSGHLAVHAATPPLTPAAYAYDIDGGTGVPVNDCIGCHASNLVEEHLGAVDQFGTISRLPRFSTAGQVLTCASCHSSTDPVVLGAIAASNSACTGCHGIHEPQTAAHESTFVADPQVDCSQCHSDQLETEHNGGLTVTTASGRVLTGCAVCHDYWTTEGPRGVTVQAAIEGQDQVLCTACHSATHPDLGSHTVSGVASQECAACHDAGGTTSIDVKAIHAGAALGACAVCHNNSPRVGDLSAMTAECSSCHDGHGDLTVAHTATSSQGCVECHGAADVRTVHAASPLGECAVCHDANDRNPGRIDWSVATQECGSCHAYEPVETQHYPVGLHTAVHTDVCVNCHLMDLKAEHAKVGVTCAECHTDPQDKAIIAAGWNRNCDQCHLDSHADKPVRHTSTRTDCSTSGCHESDVAVIHDGLEQLGCGTCHTGPTQLSSELTKDCTTSGCHVAYHKYLPGLHTASASAACTRCHDAALFDGSQLEPIHKAACAKCHNATIDVSTKTAECTTCHNTTVSPFHLDMAGAHTYGGMGAACQQAGCHVGTLPEEHAKYLGRYTGYVDTCALCHENADASRIDWTTATASCDTCHTVHGDITQIHTATSSGACADCHETADTLSLHLTDTGETDCALCHAAPAGRIDWTDPSMECTYCHGTLSPVDAAHYPAAAHLATETGCNQCHYMDMKSEHLKSTVAVSCVTCHETKVDAFTAAWDDTCAACHPTKHGERQIKHVSTTTTCGGTSCHDISDVAAIHGVAGGPDCGACHINPATPATTTDCTASGCHAGVGTDHRGLHEAATVNPNGCSGCHFTNLVDEHEQLGFTCATCHNSTVPAVTAAIAANDLRCAACHPGQHGQQNWEFNPGRASVHRVSAELPGMRSSFSVNGSTYSWSLPSASTFLKTGWTTSSMMGCSDCHSYTGATGPHGATMQVNIDPAYPSPFPVIAGSSRIAQLSPSSPTGMSMTDGGSTPAGVICEKCHDLTNGSTWSNIVHKEHGDRGREGGYCNHCHTGLAHGWSRPRMIGYTTDAAPYKTTTGGIQRISLKSYSPNGWQKSDCGAGCSSGRHPLSGSSWPAVDGGTTPPAPTAGTVSGTVKDSATNAAISGATVTIGTKTATTSSTGAYTLTDVAAGSYAISASASTYNAWAGSVTVTAGSTTTQNITLVKTPVTPPAPTATNLARTGTASASSTDSGSYAASEAIDGSTSTYWRANGSGTEWLRVDLGSTKTVNSVVVDWYGTRYARTYRIETSPDGSTWTSHFSTIYGNGGVDTIALSSVSARYVRVYMTRANDGDYRIREFEVWGY
ncbi:MAG: discoidin domain-containing protein [Coriobacteriia bacterium]